MRRIALALAVLAGGQAGGAHAFDCARATSPSEKAICADPAALAADAEMSKAFASLQASLEPARRAGLAMGQVAWLRNRDFACNAYKGPPLGACLARQSDRRRAFLMGRNEQGPGASGPLAPWFRVEKGGKGRSAVDLELLKFVEPKTAAERAFNGAVEKLAASVEEPDPGDPKGDDYDTEIWMSLVYASPRLLSAQARGYSFTGGAHPTSFTTNVNIDVAAGRELKFDDAFDAGAAPRVFALCLTAVQAQKKVKLGDGAPEGADAVKELAKEIAEATGNLAAWSFGAEKATVSYNAYDVGAYFEGPYDCELPYSALRPLAKPGFPLP